MVRAVSLAGVAIGFALAVSSPASAACVGIVNCMQPPKTGAGFANNNKAGLANQVNRTQVRNNTANRLIGPDGGTFRNQRLIGPDGGTFRR